VPSDDEQTGCHQGRSSWPPTVRRPSKRSLARSGPYGFMGGFWRPRMRRKVRRTRLSILAWATRSSCTSLCASSAFHLFRSTNSSGFSRRYIRGPLSTPFPRNTVTLLDMTGENARTSTGGTNRGNVPPRSHRPGTSPVPASSGQTVRHRLNCGSDRALNPPSTPSHWSGCAAARTPGPTSDGALPRERHHGESAAASSATSPASSTASSLGR
jgi:hypothetical protein